MTRGKNISTRNTHAAPKSLQQLQSIFKAYLFDDDQRICGYITSATDEEDDTKLQIYQNAYYLRLLDSLKEDYGVLYSFLGEEEFTHLALAYIRKFPSPFPSLRHFGHLLSEYIRQSEHFQGREHVAELANLQWLLIEVFDAADQATIGEIELTRIPAQHWPHLTMQFIPSVHWFACRCNTIEIYSSIKEELPVPKAKSLEHPEIVLVWRHEMIVRYRTLDHDEGTLLVSAMQGANFAELCDELAADSDENQNSAIRAAGILKQWLHYGIIADIH